LQEDAPAPNPLKRTSADDRRKGRHAKPRAARRSNTAFSSDVAGDSEAMRLP